MTAREIGCLGFSCFVSALRPVYPELVEWNGDVGAEILGIVYMSIPGAKGTADIWAVD